MTLTREFKGGGSAEIFLAANIIASIEPRVDCDHGTLVTTQEGRRYFVQETCNEVMRWREEETADAAEYANLARS